jgi:hypothetical protein
MRGHGVSLIFGGLFVLATVPTGAAPSVSDDAPSATASVAVQRVHVPDTGLRDEAAMVLVGTALICLAAAVRRAP